MGKQSQFHKEVTHASKPAWTYRNPDDKVPEKLGDDDLSWAMANQMAKMFTRHGVSTGKSDAWFYFRVKAGLDRTGIRQAYSSHPEYFRDGNNKILPLTEFGRNMVNYFFSNSQWQYETSAEAVTGMLCDPVTLADMSRRLRGVYASRRQSRRD